MMNQGGNLDARDFKRQILDGDNVGRGYLASIPLQICTRPNNGSPPAQQNGVAYNVLDASADFIVFSLALPADYDNSTAYNSSSADIRSDEFYLELYAFRVDASSGPGTGTSTIEVDTFKYGRVGTAVDTASIAGSATTVTLTSAQTNPQTVSNTLVSRYRWNLSGLGLRPNDCVNVAVGCTIQVTDQIIIYGGQFLYRTNVKPTNAFTETDSNGALIRY